MIPIIIGHMHDATFLFFPIIWFPARNQEITNHTTIIYIYIYIYILYLSKNKIHVNFLSFQIHFMQYFLPSNIHILMMMMMMLDWMISG